MSKSLRSPAHDRLIALIRQAREKAGLTQAAAAGWLGKPQSYIAKIEGSERRLDVVEFVRLMRTLGADPAAIIAQIDAAIGAEEPAPVPTTSRFAASDR